MVGRGAHGRDLRVRTAHPLGHVRGTPRGVRRYCVARYYCTTVLHATVQAVVSGEALVGEPASYRVLHWVLHGKTYGNRSRTPEPGRGTGNVI